MMGAPPASSVGLPLPEGGQEEFPELDEELLEVSIEVVEEWLDQQGRILTPEKKAKAITAVYVLTLDAEGKLDPRHINRVLRLVS